ncbi:phycobilisome rod-core linker polypeptide [Nostoc sp.]|uniref:phycobilisome rod-core linker polypeptide n=1 Tax=Nostoc sp. TaxID=1180 RepID=UPI002FFB24E0
MGSIVINSPKVELWQTSSNEEVEAVIRAVYKQVLGNAYLLESERLVSGESQLRHQLSSTKRFNTLSQTKVLQKLVSSKNN